MQNAFRCFMRFCQIALMQKWLTRECWRPFVHLFCASLKIVAEALPKLLIMIQDAVKPHLCKEFTVQQHQISLLLSLLLFPAPILEAPHTARFACLLNQTHLIQVISSLLGTSRIGVSEKGDVRNVQCWGASGIGVGNHWYSTVSVEVSQKCVKPIETCHVFTDIIFTILSLT